MMNEEEIIVVAGAAAVAIGAVYLRQRRRRARRQKRWWIRNWLLQREQHGHFHQLLPELQVRDVSGYYNYTRMPPAIFAEILEAVGPLIAKQDTNMRRALEPGLKLAITLRYMATGNSYKSLAYAFRVAPNTICNFIPEVCLAIVHAFERQLALPTQPERWKEIAKAFETKWNLPNCIGALDGKHVAIRCPKAAGSLFYNYKGFHSIVLMALVDADYKFIYVQAGCQGSASDGGVFRDTVLRQLLDEEDLGLPPPEPLPGTEDNPFPYYIVGDEAFPLKTWLLKPVPRKNLDIPSRVYNYRISRARRVVENAFGLLSHRFRCFLTTMPQRPTRVTYITMAACVLHNILRDRVGVHHARDNEVMDREDPQTHDVAEGVWRGDRQLHDLGEPLRHGNASRDAKAARDYLRDWVNSPAGSVPWQLEKI